MSSATRQTLLSTVRKPIDVGSGGLFTISNFTGSAVLAKVYLVPVINPSSTISHHILWIESVAANTTVFFSEHNGVFPGSRHRIEAEAASNDALVFSVIAQRSKG